jgi:hypothetical protein
MQAGQSAEQAALAALQSQQNQAAAQPPAPAPLSLPPLSTNPTFTNPIAPAQNYTQSQQTPVVNPSYMQWYDQQFLNTPSNPQYNANLPSYYAPLSSYQSPYFNSNPTGYTYSPTSPNYSAPVYYPLSPGFTASGTPAGGTVPSTIFGSGPGAFSVQGHYVTLASGGEVWVPG